MTTWHYVCIKCGKELPILKVALEEMNFCPYCGKTLAPLPIKISDKKYSKE